MTNYSDDDFLSEEEFEELVSGAWNRKRVICQAILNEAKTPEAIMAVARSIGEYDYGDDDLVLQILSDYWAEEDRGRPRKTKAAEGHFRHPSNKKV